MALETFSKNGVEIFSTGTFNGDRYTDSDLQSMVDAFHRLNFEPPIKAGHERGQESPGASERLFGLPALGFVKNIYVRGGKLLADLKDIPKRFADLINAGAYKRISAEIYFDLKDEQSGKTWPRVLRAISFLGAQIPALTNLKAIESLYNRGSNIHVATFEFSGKGENIMQHTEQEKYNRPSMSSASYALTEDIRDYAQTHKLGFRDAAVKVFAEAAQGPGATQHLGALLSGAIAAGDMDLAVKIANSMPALVRDAASECLLSEAKRIASVEGMTGMDSANQLERLKMAMKQYPDVASMQVGGSVTEQAIKTIYGQWFKS